MKKATANRGASITRTQITRKLRRMEIFIQKSLFSDSFVAGHIDCIEELRDWIKSMDERAAKKPGGLGRKRSGAAK